MTPRPDLELQDRVFAVGCAHGLIGRLGRAQAQRAVDALVGVGCHFINRFGRLQTEEFVRWHGPEPAVPALLRR